MVVALFAAAAAAAAVEVAPTWPGPIAPVWPTQFTAPVSGWDNATTPSNFTGTMHYDWVNNLLRYDSNPTRGAVAAGAKPLAKSSRVWVAEPRPTPDPLASLGLRAGVYQFDWDAGSCVSFVMAGLSVERPDSFVHVGAAHKAREKVDGRWTDYWYYWFNGSSPMGPVSEPFNMWEDIEHNWPVQVYGPLSPPDMTEWGATVWHKLSVGAPDLTHWTGLDYSVCQNFSSTLPALSSAPSLHSFVHLDRSAAGRSALLAKMEAAP